MKTIARPGVGLMLIALTALLNGCAAESRPCSEPVMPPAVLLQQVPEPVFTGRTNGEMLAWALSLRQALRLANSDKKALTQWYESIESGAPGRGTLPYSTTR